MRYCLQKTMKLLAFVTLFFAFATVHAADGSLRGVEVTPDGRELWSFDWTNIMCMYQVRFI